MLKGLKSQPIYCKGNRIWDKDKLKKQVILLEKDTPSLVINFTRGSPKRKGLQFSFV